MPQIQCLLGPTVQTIAGHNYAFEFDAHGRAVATVHDGDHAKVFLAVEHYREVLDEPAAPAAGDGAVKIAVPATQEPAAPKKPRGRPKREQSAAAAAGLTPAGPAADGEGNVGIAEAGDEGAAGDADNPVEPDEGAPAEPAQE